MIELLIFVFVLLALCMGGMMTNQKWTDSSKRVQRTYCSGKLYWVIEDGDKDKLDHVIHCFDIDRQHSMKGDQ